MREQEEQSAFQEEEIRQQEAVLVHYDDIQLYNTKLIDKLRELGQGNFVETLFKKIQGDTESLESVRDI